MPGLIRGVARTAVIAGTASAVGGRVNHRQQQKWAAQDAQNAPQQQYVQQAPAPAQAAPAPDPIQQLKELGELHSQGILTDDEFAQEKAKILNG
ncbi:MAG: SHOCT domain-containing protein [Actinomycetes bacterium]